MVGAYGLDYAQRVIVVWNGGGTDLPQGMPIATAKTDTNGTALDSTHRYVLHFERNQLPSENAGWVIAALSPGGQPRSTAEHPGLRNMLSEADHPRPNHDGSLDILIQCAPPKGMRNNWLSPPTGPFLLRLQLMWPKEAALDASWLPPVVQRRDAVIPQSVAPNCAIKPRPRASRAYRRFVLRVGRGMRPGRSPASSTRWSLPSGQGKTQAPQCRRLPDHAAGLLDRLSQPHATTGPLPCRTDHRIHRPPEALIIDTLTIRRAGASKASACIDALADVLIDCAEGGASASFMAPLSQDKARAFWRNVAEGVARGERASLIVEDEAGTIHGIVQLMLAQLESQPHRADATKMFAHHRARRQGVTQRLMAAIEDETRAEGKMVLVLDTVTGGDAERLYARAGWQHAGVVPNYALIPDGAFCETTFFCKQLCVPDNAA